MHALRASVAYRMVALAAALVLAALIARQLVSLLSILTITIILSLPLSVAASQGQRIGLPRPVGAFAALVAIAGVMSAVGFAVIPTFASQVKQFANQLPSLVRSAERSLHVFTGHHGASLASELSNFVHGYTTHPGRLIGPLEQVGLGAAGVIIAGVLVVLGAYLIAVNPDPLVNGMLSLLPPQRRPAAREMLDQVRVAWLGWLTAIGIDMLVLGGLLFGGMKLIGLPFAAGFAIFSALMTVIPNYGSIVSAIPPILAGLGTSLDKALLVLLVYVIVNQIEGNLILPLVMARRVDLHPALVSIGLLLMGALFGLIGVIISIPLLSLLIILVQGLWIAPMEAAGT